MRHPLILFGVALFFFAGCGDDPAPETTDPACAAELSYRLTISNTEGEMASLSSNDFDPASAIEVKRLKSYIWGLAIEGTRGLARVDLGLPGSSCSTTWTISNEYPSGAPGRLIFNTGEPLLTGYRYEHTSLSGLATYPGLTVEGDLKTTMIRENFELLVRIVGPADDSGEQCVIEHFIPFTVVKG